MKAHEANIYRVEVSGPGKNNPDIPDIPGPDGGAGLAAGNVGKDGKDSGAAWGTRI